MTDYRLEAEKNGSGSYTLRIASRVIATTCDEPSEREVHLMERAFRAGRAFASAEVRASIDTIMGVANISI